MAVMEEHGKDTAPWEILDRRDSARYTRRRKTREDKRALRIFKEYK